MKQFYNAEIQYCTCNDIKKAELFCAYLKEQGYYYEMSSADTYIHLEILLYPNEVADVNKALDRIIYNDAITEVV
jgi:hypothetical protein